MDAWLGVDVSQERLDTRLMRPAHELEGAQFANARSGFEQLDRFLKQRDLQAVHICLEATGHYGDGVALFLHQAGYTVSVVNPVRIKRYAESRLSRNKTDASDAALIADFCRTQQPEAWTPPPPEQQELQALMRRWETLTEMRQQEVNRRQAGIPSPTVLETINAHIAFLDQQRAQVWQRVQDHLDQHPHLRQQRDLLTSIPGIGNLTACRLLAEIGDIDAFDSARQLAAFAGLSPRQHRSGSSVRHPTRLSKCGTSRLRRALYFPAMVAQRHNPILRTFAQRLLDAGKAKLAVLAAVMRKLLHLAFGILKSGQPFDPHYLDKRAAAP